ncbi:MAG: phage head-tail connector protein [Pacificimonas sp.]|jgi:uncharacterized phiE125 gp8 family phage protein|nr:phage head-tail connector protein [Pacificimonas sp.]
MSGADAATAALSLSEVKAFLRIEHGEEDALLAGFVRAALDMFEGFSGQTALVGPRGARVPVNGEWHRVAPTPVLRLLSVEGRTGAGAPVPIGAEAVDLQIDFCGDGWVRIVSEGANVAMLSVEAGLAADWNGLPEAVRQGVLRLTAHLYAHRDDPADSGPPAAVAALWRPWRRMRLS